MFKPVIAGFSRSPFTMARKGALVKTKPVNLLAEVIKNLVAKSNVKKEDIEDIVVGCAFQTGEQSFNIGKLTTFLTNMDVKTCLLYTSPSPRDATLSRMPSSA